MASSFDSESSSSECEEINALWRRAPRESWGRCLKKGCYHLVRPGEFYYSIKLNEARTGISELRIMCPKCKEGLLTPCPPGDN
jgi:hypothetical protein